MRAAPAAHFVVTDERRGPKQSHLPVGPIQIEPMARMRFLGMGLSATTPYATAVFKPNDLVARLAACSDERIASGRSDCISAGFRPRVGFFCRLFFCTDESVNI